jgi:hypothetical protein
MASSDFSKTGQGAMCPTGKLASHISAVTGTITISNFSEIVGASQDLQVGMAVLIDDEILHLTSVTLPTLNVERGCADTVPKAHLGGSTVWFFSNSLASDFVERVAGDTHTLKLAPFLVSGDVVQLNYLQPHELLLNWRHNSPYPPANVLCDGDPWHEGQFKMEVGVDDLVLTWSHRDRLLIADQLIPFDAASIGPEPGTEYRVRVFDSLDALQRTTVISTATWTYTRTMAEVDLPPRNGGYMLIDSLRDGLFSIQNYRVDFRVIGLTGASGLGISLGTSLGT